MFLRSYCNTEFKYALQSCVALFLGVLPLKCILGDCGEPNNTVQPVLTSFVLVQVRTLKTGSLNVRHGKKVGNNV